MLAHVVTKIRMNLELGWSLHRGGPLEDLNQWNDRTEKPEIDKIEIANNRFSLPKTTKK